MRQTPNCGKMANERGEAFVAKLGIFGGTFDPIHIGHLALAERACADCGLEQVYFVPANYPPHKLDRPVTAPEHRLAMVQSAIADNPSFLVSDLELRRSGPSYTIQTIRAFQSRHPEDELFFLMGADSVLELDTWMNVEELVTLCRFIVVQRPGYAYNQAETRVPEAFWPRTVRLEMAGLDVSSSDIRARLQQNRSVRYLVPDPVLEYAARNCLYTE